jgi:hypothetical protein
LLGLTLVALGLALLTSARTWRRMRHHAWALVPLRSSGRPS